MSEEVSYVDRARSLRYEGSALERRLPEADKKPGRSAFERDRARVLHSSALRRLGAKTQVLGPNTDDFVRTRLTHSLEVAQVGRELAIALGTDPDVVEAACLSHDMGHPPFGHNGERALAQVSQEAGSFEGNAQTFRLLTRLEPKVVDGQDSFGLNLTRTTLDACVKYPWTLSEAPAKADGSPGTKFGVYDDDLPAFLWVRADAPAGRRCLETQVMDLADDIAYSVHDVEDAFATGRAAPGSVVIEAEGILDHVESWYGHALTRDELGSAMERLLALPGWPASCEGTRGELAALKNFASRLIGSFIGATVEATRTQYGQGPLARYDADLVVPRATRAEIAVLKGIAVHYVMAPRELEPVYLAQRSLLFDLVDALVELGAEALEPAFAADYRRADTEGQRLRAIIDQVASLSDVAANQWHARYCGLIVG
ncbi:deoxyguanosinetriphosphate triphosphohydrolase [Buchananella felis]|uniref:deoxyguanosinetriphosphate triphosphohydrolase n=1 Tax=Buchananella felis TaxID=3231492 RepID=UPI0035277352